ncbi:MAG TPA: polysaccharide deacetylase family protein, partial [Candidatus Ozemobacteraceae bacterium]|nr:polysaccharide deacetylase family protein [Candidatus Ozemobacteraceae bacterium]
PNPTEALMVDDLRDSRMTLTEILGTPPRAIAWPYGKFNNALRRIAQDQGFRLHFTSISGYNEPGVNPFSIKRVPITNRDTALHVLRKARGK